MTNEELYHHGILGQKWGLRRYQNKDGTLTERGRRRLEKQDAKWLDKNYKKIYDDTYKRSKAEMEYYKQGEMYNKYRDRFETGNFNRSMINDYNRKLAEVMNRNVDDIESPSKRIVQFVAKRGEFGVHMALASRDYDMSQVSRGVWSNGRVAYKKNVIDRT